MRRFWMGVILVLAALSAEAGVQADEVKVWLDDKLELHLPADWSVEPIDSDGFASSYNLSWKRFGEEASLIVLHTDSEAFQKLGGNTYARKLFQEMREVENRLDMENVVTGAMQMQGCEGERLEHSYQTRVVRLELCFHPDGTRAYIWRMATESWQFRDRPKIMAGYQQVVQRARLIDDSGLPVGVDAVYADKVDAAFEARSDAVAACYTGDAKRPGAVAIQLQLSTSGAVTDVNVLEQSAGEEVGACVQKLARGWTFPTSDVARTVARRWVFGS